MRRQILILIVPQEAWKISRYLPAPVVISVCLFRDVLPGPVRVHEAPSSKENTSHNSLSRNRRLEDARCEIPFLWIQQHCKQLNQGSDF